MQKGTKVEEALRESEERYRFMFENNPQPMFIYDLETLAFLQVNRAIIEQFGYSQEEFLSMTLKDIHRDEDIEKLMLDIEKAKSTYNPSGEWINVKKNGEIIHTEIVAQSVSFNSRPARHVLSIDITKRKLTENALRESEERYHSLFDNTTIGFYRTTPDGKILMANPTIIRLLGYNSFEQLANRNLNIEGFEPNYSREDFKQRLEVEGEIKGFESAWTRTDGSTVFIRESAKVVLDKHQNISYYEGTIEDITEQKLTENQLIEAGNHWQTTFDTVKDGICLLNNQQQIVRCNKAMTELFPNCNKSMLGKPCWEGVHGILDPLHDCPIIKMKQSLKRESIEIKVDERWFDITIDPIFDNNNKYIGAVHIARNITERKLAEESLIQLNEKLKALNVTKDRLFTIIAHDLKSPFNSILGLSELLINNLHSYNIEKSVEFVSQINNSAKNTLSLIDNLLAWANSQMGQITYQPENILLLPVVQEVIELLSPTAKIKNIAILYFESELLEAYADKNLLQVVIRNLISNAIKFSKLGGRINVYSVSENEQIIITISDNGIGISDKNLANLFHSSGTFTTNGTAHEKGSGLGLFLCKEFVEKQGGKIWVESEVGIGSEFKFTLPKSCNIE